MINKKVEESITTDTFRTEKDSIGAKNVPEDLDNILDPVHMTEPGISGKELLKNR